MGELSRRDTVRLIASVDLISRTGASQYNVEYQEGPDPVTWVAQAQYQGAREWAEALDPVTASERLVAKLVDGGQCTHCGRVTMLEGGPSGRADPRCSYYRLGGKYLRSCI